MNKIRNVLIGFVLFILTLTVVSLVTFVVHMDSVLRKTGINPPLIPADISLVVDSGVQEHDRVKDDAVSIESSAVTTSSNRIEFGQFQIPGSEFLNETSGVSSVGTWKFYSPSRNYVATRYEPIFPLTDSDSFQFVGGAGSLEISSGIPGQSEIFNTYSLGIYSIIQSAEWISDSILEIKQTGGDGDGSYYKIVHLGVDGSQVLVAGESCSGDICEKITDPSSF